MLNSLSVDAGVEDIDVSSGLAVCFGPSINSRDLQINELYKLHIWLIALACIILSVRGAESETED